MMSGIPMSAHVSSVLVLSLYQWANIGVDALSRAQAAHQRAKPPLREPMGEAPAWPRFFGAGRHRRKRAVAARRFHMLYAHADGPNVTQAVVEADTRVMRSRSQSSRPKKVMARKPARGCQVFGLVHPAGGTATTATIIGVQSLAGMTSGANPTHSRAKQGAKSVLASSARNECVR